MRTSAAHNAAIMNQPKRHHILAESYLEHFCERGKLWVYDRTVDKFRQQTPRNTAVQQHYYSYSRPDGDRVSDFETRILSPIDGAVAPLLDRLNSRKRLTNDDYEVLALFIGSMFVRVPKFESLVKTVAEEKVDNSVEANADSKLDTTSPSPTDAGFIQAMRAGLLPDFGREFVKYNWYFGRASKGSAFVTCDNPLSILSPPYYDAKSVGIATPGVLKVLPLTSSVCLTVGDRGQQETYKRLPKTFVKWFNHAVVVNSTRFVFARDEALLKSEVRKAKNANWSLPTDDNDLE